MIGDGEELLEQVCLLKMECDSKKEFLQRACKLQGVYVPAFYEPIYNESGTIKEIKKLYEEAPDRVKRAVVEDLDKAEFPVKNIVPFIDTVHDRCVVETFRGWMILLSPELSYLSQECSYHIRYSGSDLLLQLLRVQ